MSGPRRPDPPEFPRPRPQRRPGPPPGGKPWRPELSEQDTVPISKQIPRRQRAGGPQPPVDSRRRTVEAPQWWQRNPRTPTQQPPRPPARSLAAQPLRPAPPPASPPPARDVPAGTGTGDRHRRGLLIGAGLAGLLVLVVILTLSLTKLFDATAATVLDVNAAQAGVQQVLTDPIDGYGRDDVTDVRCNGGRNPTVKSGSSFSCEVNVNGIKRHVTVVFSDDAGTYEVDRLR